MSTIVKDLPTNWLAEIKNGKRSPIIMISLSMPIQVILILIKIIYKIRGVNNQKSSLFLEETSDGQFSF